MASTGLYDWTKAPSRWVADPVRFLTSPHCRDLLGICLVAMALAIGFVTAVYREWLAASDTTTALGAAALAAAFAAIAWAYQSSNQRFGAADIFAAEIVTLCRISAVVAFVKSLVDGYEPGGKPVQPAQSTQDYVVIFHNNSKDLEILDGSVVSWVTEFYVFFKAMLDTMSRLPQRDDAARPPWETARKTASSAADPYREALLNTIYMAFLMFESGREALMRLIDDKHARTDAVLTALLSEVPAYIFLYRAFESRQTDIRWQRISCRLSQYRHHMENVARTAAMPIGSHRLSPRIRDLANEVKQRWDRGWPEPFGRGEPLRARSGERLPTTERQPAEDRETLAPA